MDKLNNTVHLDNEWTVYLIRTKINSLYCGITLDINRRFAEHQANGAKTAKYLKGKQPLILAATWQVKDKKTALSLEYKIKQLDKKQKERLCQPSFVITSLLA